MSKIDWNLVVSECHFSVIIIIARDNIPNFVDKLSSDMSISPFKINEWTWGDNLPDDITQGLIKDWIIKNT